MNTLPSNAEPTQVCEAADCDRRDGLSHVDRLPCASRAEVEARLAGDAEGDVVVYCRYHRKHALGVTT